MGLYNKNTVYESARELSKTCNCQVYVWENDFGGWQYGTSYPDQYSEIIATFENGIDLL